MPNKTIKLYFQVSSETESSPTDVELTIDGSTQTFSLEHTAEWSLEVDEANAQSISMDVNAPEYTEDSEIPRVDLSIRPLNGSVILVHAEENYTVEYGDELEDGSIETILTEDAFAATNIDIISQPLIDGEEDATRYNFSMHDGLGYGGGEYGMGNLPIADSEVASFTLGHDFYTTATA